MGQAARLHQFKAGNAGGARAVHHHLAVGQFLAGDLQGVDDTGKADDGRAVLVVVKDRDVDELPQALLDDETLRRLDVLEIDAAECRADELHRLHDLVDILAVDFDIDAVDIGESLEEDRLSLHDRFGAESAEIAQSQDRRTIGDDGDDIALGGVVEDGCRFPVDLETGRGDPRRVGEREIPGGVERLCRRHRQLAGTPLGVELEGIDVTDPDLIRHGMRRFFPLNHEA